MADNFVTDAGTGGNTYASDDVGTVHYPILKIAHGPLDSVTLVSTSSGLPVQQQGTWTQRPNNTVSSNNSTTSTLGISGVYTGTGEDVSGYTSVTVAVDSSHDSATNGMTFQFSTDNSNWDDVYSFTYTASQGARRFQFPVTSQYFRVVYTNGGTGQTHFRLQTILHANNVLTSIHRVESNVSPDRSATLVKSVLVAQVNGSGDFIPVQSTASGILKVGGSVDVDDISAGTQTNDVKVTMDGEAIVLGASDGTDIGNVDVASVPAPLSTTGGGTEAAALRVTLASDSTGVISVDDNAGSLTVDSADLTTLAGAVAGSEMQVDVVGALPAGTNAIGKLAANSGVDIGDVDVLSIAAGTNAIGNVGLVGRTSGGLSIFRSLDLDETEEEVKATAGQVFTIFAFNTTAAPIYLKFYNATAATVVVGTTTPVLTLVVPGNADSDGAGFVWTSDIGFAFGTAITVAATTGVADADTGPPGANACIVNIGYV